MSFFLKCLEKCSSHASRWLRCADNVFREHQRGIVGFFAEDTLPPSATIRTPMTSWTPLVTSHTFLHRCRGGHRSSQCAAASSYWRDKHRQSITCERLPEPASRVVQAMRHRCGKGAESVASEAICSSAADRHIAESVASRAVQNLLHCWSPLQRFDYRRPLAKFVNSTASRVETLAPGLLQHPWKFARRKKFCRRHLLPTIQTTWTLGSTPRTSSQPELFMAMSRLCLSTLGATKTFFLSSMGTLKQALAART